MTGNKIFITGGGGFIGSWLCEELIKENEIVVYDNQRRDSLQYTSLREHPNFKFIKGDILDKERIEYSMKECNIIIHLAAIAGIDTVAIKPIETMRVNMIGTYNVLEAAQKCEIELLINFSTSEVYGPFIYRADEKDMTTQGEVGVLRWVYSVSKLASEHLCYCYFDEYKLATVTIRPFNVYGPQQVGEGAMQKFIVKALKNEDLVIYGDGNQIRAWCYIDDLIQGVLLCLKSNRAIGNVFNIGNPSATITVSALAEKVIALSGSKSKISFKKRDYPDVEVRVPSIHKAEKMLGFQPKVSLDEGIKRTLEWYKDNWQQ